MGTTIPARHELAGGQHASRVLRTRLLPPRVPAGALTRPELVERILAGLRGRLVAVVAGAGYGKSTLLAQALAHCEMPWAWLSCDERIAEGPLFLRHTAAALAERFPGVGTALDFRGRVDDLVADLANEVLSTVSDEVVLALDDVHALSETSAADALRLLVRDLPANVHLAVASRVALPFPVGPLMPGGLVEIDERALALAPGECARLLEQTHPGLDSEAVADVHRQTEGWLAGVLLLGQAGGPAADASGREGRHFDYLAEEVLLRQPPELQAFLLDSAVLDRFTPELAAAVTGRAEARELIAELVARHLFVARLAAEGEWYRYHHLFHRFLRGRIEDSDPGRLPELHRAAAAAWTAVGEPVEAARHLLLAGDEDEALAVLEPDAERLADAEPEALAACLEAVPRARLRERPALLLSHARLCFGRGDYQGSVAAHEEALGCFLDAGDHDRAALALYRLLNLLVMASPNPERGLATCERYLSRIDPAARMLALARIVMSAALGFAGRFEEAEAQLAAAQASPPASTPPLLDLYADTVRALYVESFRGRPRAAAASLAALAVQLTAREDEDELGFIVWAHAYTALTMAQLGRWEDCLRAIAAWREAGVRHGWRGAAEQLARWPLMTALIGLERWDELEAELPPSARSASRIGNSWAARHHAAAARLAAHRGDAAAVHEHIRQASAWTDGPGHVDALIQGDAALAAAEVGLLETARAAAHRGLESAVGARARWAEARLAIIGAAVEGPGPAGDELLRRALELTAELDVTELWTHRERPLAGPLLARAIAGGIGPHGLPARLLASCGAEVLRRCAEDLAAAPAAAREELARAVAESPSPDADVVETLVADRDERVRAAARDARRRLAARPRPPLRFAGLGGFAVHRGGAPVPPAAFGRERARAMLAALLAAGRPVHREELVDWFWPTLAPARGTRAFHVTLHGLRRALEPTLERGAAASVVALDGETYRVVLADGDEFDAATFLGLAATPPAGEALDAQIARLRRAEAAYTGPLFPEWPYAEWSAERRGEVERALVGVLERLAVALTTAGDPQAATLRYQRLLELEPEREQWHRALMRVHAQGGERALALRQYHACRAVLRRELGVEPSDETRSLYLELLG